MRKHICALALCSTLMPVPALASYNDQLICQTPVEDRYIVELSSDDRRHATIRRDSARATGESVPLAFTHSSVVQDGEAGPILSHHYAGPNAELVLSGDGTRAQLVDKRDGSGLLSGTQAGSRYVCTLIGEEGDEALSGAEPAPLEAQLAMMDRLLVDPAVFAKPDGLAIRHPGVPGLRLVPLGTPRSEVVAILSRYLGSPQPDAEGEPCPLADIDTVRFGGLWLSFMGDQFAGWSARGTDDGAIRTLSGLSTGMTIETLRARGFDFSESSVGPHFEEQGMRGVFGPQSGDLTLLSGFNCTAE